MRVAIFTGNQPRHLSLVRTLADVADQVYAVQECTTAFPGQVADFFRKSRVMQTYFGHVMAAERAIFGDLRFMPAKVRTLSIKAGDLSMLPLTVLDGALACDIAVVFGASWIREPLIDALVARRAINIHMGISPYYRGSSCNFWALYDGNADLVGATIHRLSRGLDSGDILFHALPDPSGADPWALGMRAVRAAHIGLADAVRSGSIDDSPIKQDRQNEIRYTRNADFTDEVAADYLRRKLTAADVADMIGRAPVRDFYRPVRH